MPSVDLDDITIEDESPRPLLIFEHLFQMPSVRRSSYSTSSSHSGGFLGRTRSDEVEPPTPPASGVAGKDEQSPRFKDQVHPSLVEPDLAGAIEQEHEEAQKEEEAGIPIASALLVPDSEIRLEERVQVELERQRLNFELELQRLDFLERQHASNQHQQLTGSNCGSFFASSKKRWIGGIIATVMTIVALAAVASVCVSGNCHNNGSSSAPPQQQLRSTRATAISSYVNSITLTGRPLRYPNNSTAEERALQWLIGVDLVTSESNTLALRQRYGLGTLWFQMATGFGDTNLVHTWTNDITECAWESVDCNSAGILTSLQLIEAGIEGRIPDDLGLLTDLNNLSLANNELEGTIPTTIASLTALTTLSLTNNTLTGSIPSVLCSLTALTDLDLSENALTGTIPTTFGLLTALTDLYLTDNTLTGTIPSSLGKLTASYRLALWNNALTGTIPSSIGSLTDLIGLFLDGNKLNGTIPSSLASLTALTYLHLFQNSLTGTMPFCGSNQSFYWLVADCDEVICPCCTHCCPTSRDTIPVYEDCSV